MSKNIDALVPEAFGGLDENSQPSAVAAALNSLVQSAKGLPAMQTGLLRKQAGQFLRDKRLGTQEIADVAFSAAAAASADPGLWVDEEPWPEPVVLADVLNDVSARLRRHVVMSDGQANLIALWVAYTYVFDLFDVAPYLVVTSATRRCGKTTLFSIIEKMVNRPLMTSNTTVAVIFRSIEKWQPTLLIDEGDTFLNTSQELTGILNSGHSRSGARVLRCVGDDHVPTPFSTWAPKGYAAIGRLPRTLEDRSLIVRLKRRTGQPVERLSLTAFGSHLRPAGAASTVAVVSRHSCER